MTRKEKQNLINMLVPLIDVIHNEGRLTVMGFGTFYAKDIKNIGTNTKKGKRLAFVPSRKTKRYEK